MGKLISLKSITARIGLDSETGWIKGCHMGSLEAYFGARNGHGAFVGRSCGDARHWWRVHEGSQVLEIYGGAAGG